MECIMNEYIKKHWQAASLLPSSALSLCFLFFPLTLRLLNANKIHCVRANAFQDLQNLSLLSLYDNKIQTVAKGTFTSLRAIQTLWVEHTHINMLLLRTLWHILSCHHQTWAKTGVVYLQVCVITQNDEVERRVNLSSSQTHGHTQLLRPDPENSAHHTLFPPPLPRQHQFGLNECSPFFSFPINKETTCCYQYRPHTTAPPMSQTHHMRLSSIYANVFETPVEDDDG